MRLVIKDHYEDTRHTLEGSPEDVRSQVLDLYPFLLVKFGPHADIAIYVNALNKNQGTTAAIKDSLSKSQINADGQGLHIIRHDIDTKHGQISTTDSQIEACRAAAEFLAGHPCSDQEMRQALLQEDGDPYKAAVVAHGLEDSAVADIKAIIDASLSKAEDQPVQFKTVASLTESGAIFATAIKSASDAGEVFPIKLGSGKHNKGTLKARDSENHQSYILKPGSGKQNPVQGEEESGSTQSQREAAFYNVAVAWGLGEYLPECRLLLIDGAQFACTVMLPMVYKNFNDLKALDPNLPKRLLHLYNDGTLHKWATLDYVCGNPDRHYGNVMASGDKVKLIDHGSAFAGASFDPAHDKQSFVPCYLRPGVPGWSKLSTDQKLRALPRLNAENESKFRKWLLDLNKQTLSQLLIPFGIDPTPEHDRLERLQKATSYQTADLAILSCWVVG
jgi:hypothetical protein